MQQAHDACKSPRGFQTPRTLPGPQSGRQASPEQYCASRRRKRAAGPETAIQKAAAQRTQTAGTASQASRPLGTRHVRRHSGRLPPIACYAGLLLCSTRTRTKGRVPPLSLPDKKKKKKGTHARIIVSFQSKEKANKPAGPFVDLRIWTAQQTTNPSFVSVCSPRLSTAFARSARAFGSRPTPSILLCNSRPCLSGGSCFLKLLESDTSIRMRTDGTRSLLSFL